MRLVGRTHVGRVATEEESRITAREQERRDKRLRTAMRAPWPELKRADLEFERHEIRHVPTGTRYTVMLGEVDAQHVPVAAYFISQSGGVVFLEKS